jgi:hypothetical protein
MYPLFLICVHTERLGGFRTDRSTFALMPRQHVFPVLTEGTGNFVFEKCFQRPRFPNPQFPINALVFSTAVPTPLAGDCCVRTLVRLLSLFHLCKLLSVPLHLSFGYGHLLCLLCSRSEGNTES